MRLEETVTRRRVLGSAIAVPVFGLLHTETDQRTYRTKPDQAGATTPTESATETMTETETTTDGSTDASRLQISGDELVVNEGQYTTEAYVMAEISNTGETVGFVTVTVDWYDDAGNYLDNSTGYLPTLPAGETWLARIQALLADNSQVADYELSVEFEEVPPKPPKGVKLVESQLRTGETVQVTGRIANQSGHELSYIEALVLLYDADGNVLAGDWTNQSGIPDGKTWKFTLEFFVFDRVDALADHKVILDEGL